jgi:rod shape-determining protein MreC
VRNLIDFLQNFKTLFLFLVLQFICFKLLLRGKNNFAIAVNNTSKNMVGGIFTEKKKVTNYFELKEINDSLLVENRNLQKRLNQEIVNMPIQDSTFTVDAKADSLKKKFRFIYRAAKVIDNTFDKSNNYATISIGSYDGVKKGMSVLSSNGIVGKIVVAGSHYSIARTIISSNFVISAQLKDGNLGKLVWNGKDSRLGTLEEISQSVIVKPGDSVFTSSHSLTFPENLWVGRIVKTESSSGSSFNYSVLYNTNFKRLQYVYVVEDISEEEIIPLIDSAIAISEPKAKK